MERVLIFGATPEGRSRARMLRQRQRQVVVSVATEFEKEQLPVGINCHVGRLDREAMLAYIRQVAPNRVVDATHPYAVAASANIQDCCQALHIPCERIQFPPNDEAWRESVEWCATADQVVRAIQRTQGNVLLGIGKEPVDTVGRILNRERLYPRVIPTAKAVEDLQSAGFLQQNIIAMEGPFSKALTMALFDEKQISVVAVKDATNSTYLHEMVIPALERGMHVIMFGSNDA